MSKDTEITNNPVLFLDIKNIGKLFIDKVLVFYEDPVLFTCYTKSEQYFLVNCLEICRDYREWAIVQTSKKRLVKGLKGNISIYDLLKYPENGFLLIAKEEYSDGSSKVSIKAVPEDEIIDDFLPDKDSSYEFIKDTSLAPFEKSINQIAIEEHRNILDITFENLQSKSHEVPMDESSKLLLGVWDVFTSFLPKTTGTRREIPTISLSGIAPGSLILRFKIDDPNPKLFPVNMDSSIAITNMLSLISIKGNEDEIKLKLKKFQNPKISKDFCSFLETLSKTDFNIKFEYANTDQYEQSSINKNEANVYSDLFKTEITEEEIEIEAEGELVSYNSDKHRIRFSYSDESNNSISFSADLHESLKDDCFLVPSRIKGRFYKARIRKKLTDTVSDEYKLLSYSPVK